MKEKALKDMDIKQILQYHNCGYPCLMVDYMSEVVPGRYAKGYKNFTYNEWFFPAHFEGDPNVPSSIQIEAMSQTLLMTFLTLPDYKKVRTACLKIDNIRFKKKIIPGNRLDLEAELKSFRRGLALGHVVGFVDGETACRADFTMGIPEEIAKFASHATRGGRNRWREWLTILYRDLWRKIYVIHFWLQEGAYYIFRMQSPEICL